MTDPPEYPASLLAASAQQRLAYFRAYTVAHPGLCDVENDLIHAIEEPIGDLILIFGGSGVGKTTLKRRVEQRLVKEALSDLQKAPGRIPVVGVEVPAPATGYFNWTDLLY